MTDKKECGDNLSYVDHNVSNYVADLIYFNHPLSGFSLVRWNGTLNCHSKVNCLHSGCFVSQLGKKHTDLHFPTAHLNSKNTGEAQLGDFSSREISLLLSHCFALCTSVNYILFYLEKFLFDSACFVWQSFLYNQK